MFSLIELVANGTFNQILIDGSILVRIDNFQAIFSQMSEWSGCLVCKKALLTLLRQQVETVQLII